MKYQEIRALYLRSIAELRRIGQIDAADRVVTYLKAMDTLYNWRDQ